MVIRRPKSKKMTALVLLILAASVFLVLELLNVTHVFHKPTDSSSPEGKTATSNTKGVKGDGDTPATGTEVSQNPSTTAPKAGSTTASSTNTNAFLISPSGTFANEYNVKLGSNMQSTCNTTPGALCQIIFTNGGTTKSLPAKTADGGGAVYWSWKPNDSNVGLSVGAWHITARATLGSQVKTADNGSLELEITQ